MTIYEKFRDSSLDLSALGLHTEPILADHSVPPTNAQILAWLINSPIHFCQIPEMADIVVAIDPEADPWEQFVPVAKDIPEFIGLLVQCKDAALIAKAHHYSGYRFNELTKSVQTSMKARSVIRALENTYHPPMIVDPFATISEIRQGYANLTTDHEWAVCFDSDFSRIGHKAHAGNEITLSVEEGEWLIPAYYQCKDGLVIDTVLKIPQNELLEYQDRWSGCGEELLSLSDKLQRKLENPFHRAVAGNLVVNDRSLKLSKCFTALWNPLIDNSPSVRRILNHYHLDTDYGYLFRRYSFQPKGRIPQIRTMALSIEAEAEMVPGQIFSVNQNGKQFRFTHPSTGLEHTFTAISITNEALDPNFLTNHPCFYTRLTYSLEPSISPGNFRVVDPDPGDFWDGYQDDPASIIYAAQRPAPGRHALSSLRHEPPESVRWQMIFRRKYQKDITIQLFS